MDFSHIGFIGLGLIGGSIAKAIKRTAPAVSITAYDTDRTTLSLSLNEGIIDNATNEIDITFSACDLIFLCTPVQYNEDFLLRLKSVISERCIITDAGSVKTSIHELVKKLRMEHCFIGGHPMAGSEKSGYQYSQDRLIENAYYIITPTAGTRESDLDKMKHFVSSLGAIPIVLDYSEHDFITASISHVPHLIASSLVNLIKDTDSPDEKMRLIAAGGFKDITRIASSSPVMWEQICITNQKHISTVLKDYIDSLEKIKRAIDSSDSEYIYHMFETSRDYRNSIPDKSLGPIKKAYSIYCDLIDEAGGIATLSTILASNHISIKNIGIIHNREFEEGVLRIEFYDEESSRKSVDLLRKYHYTVYER